MQKLKLHGFNNLTKSLSFCIYEICYAKTAADRHSYLAYIDEQYNATRLTEILIETCSIIDANILNIAHQDYEPQGASVTILISENLINPKDIDNTENSGPLPDSIVAHFAVFILTQKAILMMVYALLEQILKSRLAV